MDDAELTKIRALIARMDQICLESEQIRAELEALTRVRETWSRVQTASKSFTRVSPKPTRESLN